MTKKPTERARSILITEDDNGFTMEYPKGPLSASETIGILEVAILLRKADVQVVYHDYLTQQQEEAK